MKLKLFIAVLLSMIFCFTSVSFADRPSKKRGNPHYSQDRGRDMHRYNEDRYYHGQRRPQYRRHVPDYHRYRHWRDWKKWERHYKHNKHRYHGGHYERDDHGILMFKFCDPGGPCFSFSFFDR